MGTDWEGYGLKKHGLTMVCLYMNHNGGIVSREHLSGHLSQGSFLGRRPFSLDSSHYCYRKR